MKLLLDTHIYLWWVKDDRKLSKPARSLIMSAEEVYISSVSIWEATTKAQIGKLEVDPNDLINELDNSGFLELPLTMQHVAKLHTLPILHRDPFDRIIIAQAVSEPLTLITADTILGKYSELVKVV
jgi:PIN domain nuclease of toxin-antitoxin system